MSVTDPKVAAEVASLVYSYMLTVDRDLAAAFKHKTRTKNIPDDLPTITEVFLRCSMPVRSPPGGSQQSEIKANISKPDSKESPKKTKGLFGKSGLYKQQKASIDSESSSDKETSRSMQITSSTLYAPPANTSSTKRPQLSYGSTSGSILRSPKAPVKAEKAHKVRSKIGLNENQTSAGANHDKELIKPTGMTRDEPNNSMNTYEQLHESSTSSSSNEEFKKPAQKKKLDLDKLAQVRKALLMSDSDSNTDDKSPKAIHNSPHKFQPKITLPETNNSNTLSVPNTSESSKLMLNTSTKVLQSVKRKSLTSTSDKVSEPTSTAQASPNTQAKVSLTESTDDASSDEKSAKCMEQEVAISTQKTLVKSNFISTKITPSRKQESSGSNDEERRPAATVILKRIAKKNKPVIRQHESTDDSNSDTEEEAHVPTLKFKTKPELRYNIVTATKSSDKSDFSNKEEASKTVGALSEKQKLSPKKIAPTSEQKSTDDSNSDTEKKAQLPTLALKSKPKSNLSCNTMSANKSNDKSDFSSKKDGPKTVRKSLEKSKLSLKKIAPTEKEESKSKTESAFNSIKITTKKSSDESDSTSEEKEAKLSEDSKGSPKQITHSTDESNSDSEKESSKHTDKILSKINMVAANIAPAPEKKSNDQSDFSSEEELSKRILKIPRKPTLSPKKNAPAKTQESTDDSDSDTEEGSHKLTLETKTKPESISTKKNSVLTKKSSDESDSSSTGEEIPGLPSKTKAPSKPITAYEKHYSMVYSGSDCEQKHDDEMATKTNVVMTKITPAPGNNSSDKSDSSFEEEAHKTSCKLPKKPTLPLKKIVPAKKQESTDDSDSDSGKESPKHADKTLTKSDKITVVSLKKFTDESDSSIDEGAIEITKTSTTSKGLPKKISPYEKRNSTDDSDSESKKESPKHEDKILTNADVKSAKIIFSPTNKSSNESDSSSEEDMSQEKEESVAMKKKTSDSKQESTDDSDSETESGETKPSHKASIKADEISDKITAFYKTKSSDESDFNSDKGAQKLTKKITAKPKVSSATITLPTTQHLSDSDSHTEEEASKFTRSSPIANIAFDLSEDSSNDSDSSIEGGSKLSENKTATKPHISQIISSARIIPHRKKESSENVKSYNDEGSSESIKSKQKLDKVQNVMERSKSKRIDTLQNTSMEEESNHNSNSSEKEVAKPSNNDDRDFSSKQNKKKAKQITSPSKNKKISVDSFEDIEEKSTSKSVTSKRRKLSGAKNCDPEDKLADEPAAKKLKLHRESTDPSSVRSTSNRTEQKKSSGAAELELPTTEHTIGKVPKRVKGSRTLSGIKKTDPNKCPFCTYTAPRRSILKIHVRKHTGVRPYKCKECDKSFTVSSNLYRHKKTHSIEKSVKYRSASLMGKTFKCSSCLRTFSTSTNLYRHLRSDHLSQDINAEKLRRQKENTGRRQSELQCAHCGYVTVNRSDLKVHLRTHNGETPYKCDVCQMRFTQSSNLGKHLRKMHAPGRVEKKKPFECPVCQKPLSAKLKRHLKTHAARMIDEDVLLEKEDEQVQKSGEKLQMKGDKYKCTICEKNFATAGSLKRHSLLHTRQESEGKGVTPIKRNRGEKVDAKKIIANQPTDIKSKHDKYHTTDDSSEEENVQLKIDEEIDMNSYICNVCNKTLATKSGYTRHMKRHSSEGTEAEEGIANLTPANNERSRTDSTHTNNEKLDDSSAEDGSIETKQEKKNSKWINYFHSTADLKSNECTLCGKIFSSASSLKRHLLIHTRQDEAATPKRERRNGKQSRAEHMNTAKEKENENIVDENVWKCSGCQKAFSTALTLRQHLLIHIQGSDDNKIKETLTPRAIHPRTSEVSGEQFETNVKEEKQKIAHKIHLKCQVCEKQLSTPSSLKRHLSTHNRANTEPVEGDAGMGRKSGDDGTSRAHLMEETPEDYFSEEENSVKEQGQKEVFQHDKKENTRKEKKEKSKDKSNVVTDEREESKKDLDNAERYSQEEATQDKKDKKKLKGKRNEDHNNIEWNSIEHIKQGQKESKENHENSGNDSIKNDNSGLGESLQCMVCQKKLSNSSSLKRHLKTHTCQESHIKDMTSHLTSPQKRSRKVSINSVASEGSGHDRGKDKSIFINSDKNVFKCSICDKQFAKASKLNRHSKIHEQLGSEPTDIASAENANIKIREKSTQELTHGDFEKEKGRERRQSTHDKSHKCLVCGKELSSLSSLNRHLKTHTKNDKGLITAKTIDDSQSDHSERPSYDAVGDKRNFTPDVIKQRRKSINEKSFSCPECEKLFVSMSNLNRHSKIHTRGRSASTREESPSPVVTDVKHPTKALSPLRNQSNVSPFECTICNEVFPKASQLKRHSKTHTKDGGGSIITKIKDNSRLDNSEKPSHDTGGDKGNLTLDVQKQRKSANEKSFSCPECEKLFVSVYNLNRHSKIHTRGQSATREESPLITDDKHPTKTLSPLGNQSDGRPFECTICNEVFSKASKLKRHSKTHTKEDKGSITTKIKENSRPNNSEKPSHDTEEDKGNLTLDVKKLRRKSTTEKSFSCPECEKLYTSLSNLNRHSKTHTCDQSTLTRESPVVTEPKYPSKAFSHLRNQSDVSPFECTICNEVFSTTSNLERHSKTHNASLTEDIEPTPSKKRGSSNASPDKKNSSKKKKFTAN